MMVAVASDFFPPQHSPILGHLASSQTVANLSSRTSFFKVWNDFPFGMGTFSHSGSLWSGSCLAASNGSMVIFEAFPLTKSANDGPWLSLSVNMVLFLFGLGGSAVANVLHIVFVGFCEHRNAVIWPRTGTIVLRIAFKRIKNSAESRRCLGSRSRADSAAPFPGRARRLVQSALVYWLELFYWFYYCIASILHYRQSYNILWMWSSLNESKLSRFFHHVKRSVLQISLNHGVNTNDSSLNISCNSSALTYL